MTKAAAAMIVAAIEIQRRRQSGGSMMRGVARDTREVAGYLRPLIVDYPYEVFGILYLNVTDKILHFQMVSQGGITGTVVDPRIIFKIAFELNAQKIIVCHNHPSGNSKPSKADEILTTKLWQGGQIIGIKLIDHIIVADHSYFSFAEEGLLKAA